MLMHLSLNNPGIETPDLRVSDMTNDDEPESHGSSVGHKDLAPAMGVAYLEFCSAYTGMHAMMEGAVRGVAAAVCESDISMQLLRGGSSSGETGVRKRAFFRIVGHRSPLTCSLTPLLILNLSSISSDQVYQLIFPLQSQGPILSASDTPSKALYAPSSDLFFTLFPFHFILDLSCKLIQVRLFNCMKARLVLVV